MYTCCREQPSSTGVFIEQYRVFVFWFSGVQQMGFVVLASHGCPNDWDKCAWSTSRLLQRLFNVQRCLCSESALCMNSTRQSFALISLNAPCDTYFVLVKDLAHTDSLRSPWLSTTPACSHLLSVLKAFLLCSSKRSICWLHR